MKIKEIAKFLESVASPVLQESYDNSGLLVGDAETECTGILTSLDVTEAVVEEAVKKKCNLIVSHHPVIFRGIRRLNGKNYVERIIISAVKKDIALYAIHTNLDNVLEGVNQKIAEKLDLHNTRVLVPKQGTLENLVTFAPEKNAEEIRNALFLAGAGAIGKYDECSFNAGGTGTFRAGAGSDPYVGKVGIRHAGNEIRIEVIYPSHLRETILRSLKQAHPYEEVAYYLHSLENVQDRVGSGLIGDVSAEITEEQLFATLKTRFGLSVIRHTSFSGRPVRRIAVCGGAGIFLLPHAIASGADVYITSDIKYHEFFDADGCILLADIGHFESEQFTVDLLTEFLQQKFLNFAVLKTETITNPVTYYT
jgi:dinuclear metal center YbgI/SA1388 family protein